MSLLLTILSNMYKAPKCSSITATPAIGLLSLFKRENGKAMRTYSSVAIIYRCGSCSLLKHLLRQLDHFNRYQPIHRSSSSCKHAKRLRRSACCRRSYMEKSRGPGIRKVDFSHQESRHVLDIGCLLGGVVPVKSSRAGNNNDFLR